MIVIAGGGIGGLTLGCALSQARKPFRIFERAVELRPVGAGIALSPNAFQAFAHIGMFDDSLLLPVHPTGDGDEEELELNCHGAKNPSKVALAQSFRCIG